MKNNGKILKKRIIVFGFEGKNNKTESNYFSHFSPVDNRYILKCISSGVTDPAGMVRSIKNKRRDFDYNAKEDLTFIFVDDDCDEHKRKLISDINKTLPKDITIVRSSPIFELWFLNHFCKTTKEYFSNEEMIDDLKKYIANYNKNQDYFDLLSDKTSVALENSAYQIQHGKECTSTEVYNLLNKIIKFKDK